MDIDELVQQIVASDDEYGSELSRLRRENAELRAEIIDLSERLAEYERPLVRVSMKPVYQFALGRLA